MEQQELNTCTEFASVAFQQFNDFRNSKELCDVLLCVDDEEIPSHKLVLAASSPYFRAMFTSNLLECTQRTITLYDIDVGALQQIVEYFYTGKITIDEDNVQFLLHASCLLQVDRVRDFCSEFLAKQICVTNCLGIRALTDSFSCKEIYEAAQKFAVENFSKVMHCEEFLLQPYESLLSLIELDFLDLNNEAELLVGVMEWLRYSADTRGHFAYPLLRRLHLMRVESQILENLLQDPVIKPNRDCVELILETLEALASPTISAALEFPMFQSRRYRENKKVLLAIGGESIGVNLKSIECFDPETQQWSWEYPGDDSDDRLLPQLNDARIYTCVCSTGHHVYTIGGKSSWKPLELVERYEWPENCWKPCTPLNHSRLGAGSALLDGQLLVIGGCGQTGYLSSVESYDPLVDEWTVTKSMLLHRSYHGVASLGGNVYVVGGFGGTIDADNCWLGNAECFIPSCDLWAPIAPVREPRAYVSLASHEGSIYVLGGYNSSWLNSVERFDPREGIWYSSPPMKTPRTSMGATVLGNRIYVAGGFNGVKNINTMECYDVTAGKWLSLSPMRMIRYAMSLTTLQL
ncbi:predicted protein [Nematostella vectensis]|uniref:BTB domain-containing protein n=1 Tax=Nematostella vectensis TaxID=45351 RepID=A7S2V3_NEMVE|nr:kelch-like protein diablo [Nematostella vectensis]EDO41954.1 predicted protein [Nematostella vectensis]|eukprot:XP_001634017.1 predicted protein [Nematostella vectensis]